MKNLSEIYQALLDGEVLVTGCHMVRLNGGVQECWTIEYGWTHETSNWAFDCPNEWSIYKEPQWYDNIPDGGVLCRVRDGDNTKWRIAVVTEYNEDSLYPFRAGAEDAYRFAEPIDLNKPLAPQMEKP